MLVTLLARADDIWKLEIPKKIEPDTRDVRLGTITKSATPAAPPKIHAFKSTRNTKSKEVYG